MSSNRELVVSFYKSLETVDLDLFQSIQDPGVCYDISGHTVISGRVEGLENLMIRILPLVFGNLDMTRFSFCENLQFMCEDENCIAVIMEADGFATNGERYDQRYAHFFQFKDGKISRVIEFFDTELANKALFQSTKPAKMDGKFSMQKEPN